MNNSKMDKKNNSLAKITWFKMGKQTAQAKKVYFKKTQRGATHI